MRLLLVGPSCELERSVCGKPNSRCRRKRARKRGSVIGFPYRERELSSFKLLRFELLHSLTMLNIPIFAGFGLIALLTYKYFLYPLFLSPLSKIPSAHFSSSISPLWILYKRCVGAENRSIHAAHLKHGPIVKLAPDQVSVNCVDGGIKTIYSGGFEKSNWYHNMFDNYG